MKRNLFLLTLLFLSTGLIAQSPDLFKFQAAVRDANGDILPNQGVHFQNKFFKIFSLGLNVVF